MVDGIKIMWTRRLSTHKQLNCDFDFAALKSKSKRGSKADARDEEELARFVDDLASLHTVKRYSALLSISKYALETLKTEIAAVLVSAVLELVTSEESVQLRTQACLVITQMIHTLTTQMRHMMTTKHIKDIIHRATLAVLVEFYRVFPPNTLIFTNYNHSHYSGVPDNPLDHVAVDKENPLDHIAVDKEKEKEKEKKHAAQFKSFFDIRISISKTQFNRQIQLLFCISHLFPLFDSNFKKYLPIIQYIDLLIPAILSKSSNSHPILVATAINSLKYLTKTTRNRLRIENYYRPYLLDLIDSHQPPIPSCSETTLGIHSNEQKKPALKYLLETLMHISSIWPPLASDSSIVAAKNATGGPPELTGTVPYQLTGNLKGYAARRLALLQDSNPTDRMWHDLNHEELALVLESNKRAVKEQVDGVFVNVGGISGIKASYPSVNSLAKQVAAKSPPPFVQVSGDGKNNAQRKSVTNNGGGLRPSVNIRQSIIERRTSTAARLSSVSDQRSSRMARAYRGSLVANSKSPSVAGPKPDFGVPDLITANHLAAAADHYTLEITTPPRECLSFKIKTGSVEFGPGLNSTKLFLENTGAFVQSFIVSLSHACFKATPAFGSVRIGETVCVQIRLDRFLFSGAVKAYLFIKSKHGFPIERVLLNAYGLPAISVSTENLDFGWIQMNEQRHATFQITNLLPVDCPVVFTLVPKSENSAKFSVQNQVVIAGNQSKQITVKTSLVKEGSVNEELILVAYGAQIVKIKIRAVCLNQVLNVLEDAVHFGNHVDLFHPPPPGQEKTRGTGQPIAPQTDTRENSIHLASSKNMTFINNDLLNSLPVTFNLSTDEIVITPNPLILKPGELKTVKLAFRSMYTGKRTEKMLVNAPNSTTKTIPISCFSGPLLKIGVFEDLFLMPMSDNDESHIKVPIYNVGSETVHFNVTVPNGSLVKLEASPFAFSNSLSAANAAAVEETFQCKEYTSSPNPSLMGFKVVLPAGTTFTLKVGISAQGNTNNHSKGGVLKVPLVVSLVYPRKMEVGVFNVFTCVYDGGASDIKKLLAEFYERPWSIANYSTQLQLHQPSSETASIGNHDAVGLLRLEPAVQTIYGSLDAERSHESFEFVTLANVSITDILHYQLFISSHFQICIPTTGSLTPHSSLQIPIRFKTSYYTTHETVYFTACGCISVLDLSTGVSVASAQLIGVINDLVCFEVCEPRTIKFPDIAVMETATRQVIARNKIGVSVSLDCMLKNQTINSKPLGATTADGFMVQPKSIILKPYESQRLTVSFRGVSDGIYNGVMQSTYSLTSTTGGLVKLKPISFYGTIGLNDITKGTEYLSYGDVVIGESVTQNLVVTGNSLVPSTFLLAPPKDVVIQNALVQVLKYKQKVEVPISFIPQSFFHLDAPLSFSVNGVTHSIHLLGNAGSLKLESNIGTPFFIENTLITPPSSPPFQEHCFDAGMVAFGDTVSKSVMLCNSGTLDAVLASVTSTDDLLNIDPVSTTFVGSVTAAVDRCFNPNEIDMLEVDLDNLMWDLDSSKKVVVPRSKAALYSRRRATSVLGANKTASKLFGKTANPAVTLDDEFVHDGYKLAQCLPTRIPQFGSFEFSLRYNADKLGVFHIPITMKLNIPRRDSIVCMLWVKINVVKPLELALKKIDLGILPVSEPKNTNIVFTNLGSAAVPWTLKHISTKLTPAEYFDECHMEYLNRYRSPITIFPSSGLLQPDCTQKVDIVFMPSVPQTDVYSLISLTSGTYSSQDILIQATAASFELEVDLKKLNFGTLRVGTSKKMVLQIFNRGLLDCSFYVENLNNQFVSDPDMGVVGGGQACDVEITFQPKRAIESTGVIRIHSIPKTLVAPIDVAISGIGGYPKLSVAVKVIDFGTALYLAINKKRFEVQNLGMAEALVVFNCYHPDIYLEDADQLIVYPGQSNIYTLIYHPRNVENLNIKAFISSSDNRGETFTLNIKANVGIPKLTIEPLDALDNLDFGVMRLNKSYKKTFTVVNDGTIVLSFTCAIEQLNVTQLSEENYGRPAHNLMTPITIIPSTGKLGLGESAEIELTFSPRILADFEYEFRLSYEFQHLVSVIKGVGGHSNPKIISPFENFDFELCRLGRTYEKTIQIFNSGNLGFFYHIRPKPENGNLSVYQKEQNLIEDGLIVDYAKEFPPSVWEKPLKEIGISIKNPDGYCGPYSKMDIVIQFKPAQELAVKQEFIFFHHDKYKTFGITGFASTAKLYLFDPHTSMKIESRTTPEIGIGVHPVNFTYRYHLELVNPGTFGVDFLLQPMSALEYEIYPLRGYIEPKSKIPVFVAFRPSSESKFYSNIRVLWEGGSIKANIFGNGGVGRLEIKFLEEKDILLKTLDFGMVPFNTPFRKRFYVSNYGLVGVSTFFELENEDYTISFIGDVVFTKDIAPFVRNARETFSNWASVLKIYLPPAKSIQVGVRYLPRNSTTSVGSITVKSDSGNFAVPLKGKGGTITLSHQGDLDFGDISCNYVFTRKITIMNSGSIPANLSGHWIVVGHAGGNQAHLNLGESYSALDPRSQWARQIYCSQNGLTLTAQLSSRDYWKLILLMVSKGAVKKTANIEEQPYPTIASTPGMGKRHRAASGSSNHFKRKQMFFFLITSNQFTSQTFVKVTPFIKVFPPTLQLQSYGEASFQVELNLGSEDTFLATLVIKPDIANALKYEIPLTATPKIVNIFCDDTRILNFYRQPLGETEAFMRKFTNMGHKDVPFKFINPNSSLNIFPNKGMLKIGQSVMVTFSFTPVDESLQQHDVIFDPLLSHPIRFKMFGGGGYAKASLSRYRRFDFGHCMIGKDTVSHLPITNEGNAILHMTRFEMEETDTFFKGQNWPVERISLFPGKCYNLPLVFNPHEENPGAGVLSISTVSETFFIELIGLGREAVLIVSKLALEFSECIIGNTYEQKVGLKNIGDVNYPVTCSFEKDFLDLTFFPSSLTINPFSESFVTLTYAPSQQVKTTITLLLNSPYSSHKLPVMIHAGFANLEFSPHDLDFGMFERTTKPTITMTIRNSGTVKTNFQIKDLVKPSIFSIEPSKGLLLPKKSITVKVSHTKHEVTNFDEKLAVKTDLVDKIYYVKITGQCEETLLHEDEFSLMNMGVCPVLEPTTKALQFKNYGKFPLKFQIQRAYPLKVQPAEGEVAGGEVGSVDVTWCPSGGYELRTQLIISTNIGKYQVFVRGRSMFPEIGLSSNSIDFGVCAVGFDYEQSFQLENKGRVKLNFVIPSCKEPSFSSVLSHGTLEPKEVKDITLVFNPKSTTKFSGSTIVEVKGIHYKEILMVGIGGNLGIKIDPLSIDLERCPYGMKLYGTITIENEGDVTIFVNFNETSSQQGSCTMEIPQGQTIYPRRKASFPFGFTVFIVDRFYCKIKISTREQNFVIPVTGVGFKITLSKRSQKILNGERFALLDVSDALWKEPSHDFFELCIKRQYDINLLSLRVYEEFFGIFGRQYQEMEDSYEHSEMIPTSENRTASSRLTSMFSRGSETSRKYVITPNIAGEISGFSRMNSNIVSSVATPEKNEMVSKTLGTPGSETAENFFGMEQSSFRAPSLGKIQLPAIGASMASIAEKEAAVKEAANAEYLKSIAPEAAQESFEVQKIYKPENVTALDMQIAPESIQVSQEVEPISIEQMVAKEEELKLEKEPEQDSDIKVAKIYATGMKIRDDISIIDKFYQKLLEISAAGEIEYNEVEDLADEYAQFKMNLVPEKEEIIDRDPIINSVLQHGKLSVKDTDLDEILYLGHAFDPIDLDFLTSWPPPFGKNDQDVMKHFKKKSRKSYLTSYQPFQRNQRNAHSNPFSD